MQVKLPKRHSGPEQQIQDDMILYLRARGWYVKRIVGVTLQKGLPDLYCHHKTYRERWIELKDPLRKGDVFTPAQKEEFPKLHAAGARIYVLTAATDLEYQKLFMPPNWFLFLYGVHR